MKLKILVIIMVLSIFGVNAQSKKKIKLKTESDSISYCIGISIGNAIKSQNIEGLNVEIISKAISTINKGEDGIISLADAENFLRSYFAKKQEAEALVKAEKSKQFFTENKKKDGVIELPSGLQYKVITEGSGNNPVDSNYVKVHYKGMFVDGKVFDNSYDRGEPTEFPVTGVIPGFTEALKLMKPGSKWQIFIPPHLGYGEQGAGGVIGPNEILIFEIELIEIGLAPPPTEENFNYEDIEVEGN
jgi:FKBP-type peptidyl-prolyl cis-trans isomerase FklB